ncbi:SURP and G-patch domain-containing protein 1-like protein [Punica granatum]|uniref:SURP and G-patch domain-containing protein 1-like protein n=2 Tax=Punica granatum TaxID=22663 RepID=A0A6P8C1N5_PUNGR|nr:SURP and G-patch domain-containing protein 1-like protein [Punica granatum]XP_031375273.1 SURP and G-patch domain-containing protein 1-like protein [Punica granatum]
MDKEAPPSLFVNDGSFMERFKQLQQEKAKETSDPAGSTQPRVVVSGTSTPNSTVSKTSFSIKSNDARKPQPASGGKLAFSLKQKSKIVAPAVKLDADEDEDETDAVNDSGDASAKRQKLADQDVSYKSSRQVDVAPPPSPSDLTVKNVADKLASFVAKNGRHFEDITRQKNPGDTPFKFLFDKTCAEYKYYEYRLAEEEKALSQAKESQTPQSGGTSSSSSRLGTVSQRSHSHQSNYQTPASALYEAMDDAGVDSASADRNNNDPIAMMEFYMKKAAQEERRRQPKQSKDEMPPPPSLQASSKKGHHMGDFIPQEELEKFLASCNDAEARKSARAAAERARIQADNVGHRLLSKMGWKEGEGLGSSRSGIADPIMAGEVKKDNLGIGAQKPGEVTAEDDIYEQYKKRMMLGYRYRPNPLNNPRKSYY